MKRAWVMCGLAASLLTATAAVGDDKGASPAVADEPRTKIEPGITIFGERDSPIGLFITPWKNAYADKRLSRPTLQLDEVPLPVDPDTFRRQLSYDRMTTGYRRSTASTAPAASH